MRNRPFTPRALCTRHRSEVVAWESSLVGWTQLYWRMSVCDWSRWARPTRAAAGRFLRQVTKKRSTLVSMVYPGEYQTRKPIGVRMGKGKGKIHHRVTWLTRGQTLFVGRGRSSAEIYRLTAAINSRLPTSIEVNSRSW